MILEPRRTMKRRYSDDEGEEHTYSRIEMVNTTLYLYVYVYMYVYICIHGTWTHHREQSRTYSGQAGVAITDCTTHRPQWDIDTAEHDW